MRGSSKKALKSVTNDWHLRRECLEERQLIQRARQNDQAAWFGLVEQNQEALFRLAYLILGDPDDALDVAQEAFVRAYRNLRRFDDQYPLRPWLLRITSNLARNRRRSLGRYWAALTRFGRGEDIAPQNAPEEISVRKSQSAMLWQAVKKLRKDDQDVIYLRFFLELPVKETAQVLEISSGTVKSRLNRSLRRLETIITGEFPALREVFNY